MLDTSKLIGVSMTYFSKRTLWQNQAPSFNFELGPDEILVKALESGFVKKVGRDKYKLNEAYEGVTA